MPASDPQTPQQKRILFLGSRFHEIMQAALRGTDVAAVYTEVKVVLHDLGVTGAADQVVVFGDGSAELQEFKSIKEWGFKKLVGPKDDHLEQVKYYLFGLREYGGVADDGTEVAPLGDALGRVRFTYIEKQTLDTREFVVEWQPRWEADVRDTIAGLEAYRADPASLPPRLPTKGNKPHWMCDWGWGRCEFFTRCWKEDGE